MTTRILDNADVRVLDNGDTRITATTSHDSKIQDKFLIDDVNTSYSLDDSINIFTNDSDESTFKFNTVPSKWQ